MFNKSYIIIGFSIVGFFTLVTVTFYFYYLNRTPFLTTHSPDKTYQIDLTGQKERPIWFVNRVYFSVLKNGKPFLSTKQLHLGDAFDLSFEIGYPDSKWIQEDILHLYHARDFNAEKPEQLLIHNNSNQIVKYLIINSTDKFLIFDIKPESKIILCTTQPKGDFKWLSLEGEFYNSKTIQTNHDFDAPKGFYSIIIKDNKTEFIDNISDDSLIPFQCN